MASFFQIGLPVIALLSAAASLYLLFRMRAEFAEYRKLTQKSVSDQELSEALQPLKVRLAEFEVRLAEFDSRFAAAESRRQLDSDWLAEAESLNLNRRGQVLRLHKRGESPDNIASSLRMKPGEVQLIIKVFELGHQKSSENF